MKRTHRLCLCVSLWTVEGPWEQECGSAVCTPQAQCTSQYTVEFTKVLWKEWTTAGVTPRIQCAKHVHKRFHWILPTLFGRKCYGNLGASCLRSEESKVSKLINAQVKIHSHFKRESAAIPEELPRTSSSSNLCNVKIAQKDLWTRPKAALYSKITMGLVVKDSL